MSSRSGSRDVVWIVAGALGVLVAFVTVLSFRGNRDPVAQIASKEKRLAVVSSMHLALAAASEALNSAVMSTREQDSKTFADEARAAVSELSIRQIELDQLLKERVDSHEADLMKRVGQTVLEFQQVHQQLLDLAVQNTNRKAYDLAFGPAMKLIREMDDALARIVAEITDSASDNRLRVVQLVSEARIGILSTQVLLLPHIAEASDMKMDEFEVQLAEYDSKVREILATLKTVLPENGQTNLETAAARYAEFEQLKAQIIKLSRQNTDLKAVTIALKEKRQAMLVCQDALAALEQSIRAEPITSTIPAGRSSK